MNTTTFWQHSSLVLLASVTDIDCQLLTPAKTASVQVSIFNQTTSSLVATVTPTNTIVNPFWDFRWQRGDRERPCNGIVKIPGSNFAAAITYKIEVVWTTTDGSKFIGVWTDIVAQPILSTVS